MPKLKKYIPEVLSYISFLPGTVYKKPGNLPMKVYETICKVLEIHWSGVKSSLEMEMIWDKNDSSQQWISC